MCRYYRLTRGLCTCCGKWAEYIEFGEICSRYCIAREGLEMCQEAIIDMPFNWGDPPPYRECVPTSLPVTTSGGDDDTPIEATTEKALLPWTPHPAIYPSTYKSIMLK